MGQSMTNSLDDQVINVRSDVGRWAMVPEWLLAADVSHGAIRLFAVLAAKYADRDTHEAHPSRKRLAADLRCSAHMITEYAQELEKAGALAVTHQARADGWKPNIYVLRFAKPQGLVDTPSPQADYPSPLVGIPSPQGSHNPESVNQINTIVGGIKTTPTRTNTGLRPQADYPSPSEFIKTFSTLYEANVGIMTSLLAEELRDLETELMPMPLEWLDMAFREAVVNGVRKVSYVRGILRRWKEAGGPQERPQQATTPARKQATDPKIYLTGYGALAKKE